MSSIDWLTVMVSDDRERLQDTTKTMATADSRWPADWPADRNPDRHSHHSHDLPSGGACASDDRNHIEPFVDREPRLEARRSINPTLSLYPWLLSQPPATLLVATCSSTMPWHHLSS